MTTARQPLVASGTDSEVAGGLHEKLQFGCRFCAAKNEYQIPPHKQQPRSRCMHYFLK